MPEIVSAGSGSTFDSVPLTPEPEDGGVTIDISEPEEGDTVELSGADDAPATYEPAQFNDRFKFDIENGMFDASLRFSAVAPRSRGTDVATYNERQAVEFQVTNAAGSGSSSSALFALQFQDADPNNTTASSQVEGRAEFQRMAQQNLTLLSSL